jgi:hypothetical protein
VAASEAANTLRSTTYSRKSVPVLSGSSVIPHLLLVCRPLGRIGLRGYPRISRNHSAKRRRLPGCRQRSSAGRR